ncbi:MAG: M1 family peptidase, partial [Gemmatimonadota bacterium]
MPSFRLAGRALPVVLGLLLAPPVAGQRPDALPPTNQEMFAPMDWPAPDGVRRPGGEPGPAYWQQEADYRIEVELIPAEHRVRGSEVIHYVNHSPDDLPFVWVQLEQNLFATGSRGSLINSGSRWRGAFDQGGVQLEGVQVIQDGASYVPDITVDGTRMRVD